MTDTDIKISRKLFGILFIMLNTYPVYLSLRALQSVPQQKRLLDEMLAGESIPAITSFVFTTYRFLWVLPLISLALTVAVIVRRKSGTGLASAAVAATFAVSFVLLALLSESAMVPLLDLFEKMGR